MALSGKYERGTWDWVADQAAAYEASGGQKANTVQGRPIVVLTSIGSKSGKLRKHPVMRVEHDGEYAAVASKGGDPNHPSWYYNLVANPEVDLQDGPEPATYTARLATGAEREEWWARAVAAFPPYARYQEKVDREIPVFVLSPVVAARGQGPQGSYADRNPSGLA
jgi:deazaflavin-dependent oxidoreductase (nitroreductase family)